MNNEASMNNETKIDAKFVKASHHTGDPNHDAQWENDGVRNLQLNSADIPLITSSMKEALNKFNYKVVCEDFAHKYNLNVLNPDNFKMLVYENAMDYLVRMTKTLIEGKTPLAREFWLDETWLQADIAFTIPIHCRIRQYPGEPLKVILEYIPFATEMSIERR